MIKKVRSLDNLENGIKQLLLENRCSFSEEDKILLDECLTVIEQAKRNTNESNQYVSTIKIIELLTKLFLTADHLKDLF
jgi:hypothetical protein